MQANEDELQKALNDITNPAPASDAEGTIASPDATETAAATPVAAEPTIAVNPTPDAGAMLGNTFGETVTSAPEVTAPNEPAAPEVAASVTAPEVAATPATISATDPQTPSAFEAASAGNPVLDSVKSSILKDLAPLMDKIPMAPEKKFELYTDMLAENNDASIVSPAYEAARQISDETKRGEALLELFDKIEQLEH